MTKRQSVFVVQEVYQAKDMTISAGSGIAVAAGYGTNADLPSCPATTPAKPVEITPPVSEPAPAGVATTTLAQPKAPDRSSRRIRAEAGRYRRREVRGLGPLAREL